MNDDPSKEWKDQTDAIPDEEGIDLPSLNEADSPKDLASPSDVMDAVDKMIEAAEDKMAVDLAGWYTTDFGTSGGLKDAPDRYQSIVEATRDSDVSNYNTYAEDVVADGKYFDFMRSYFEHKTEGSRSALVSALGKLRDAYDKLDQMSSEQDITMMYSDFSEWSGKSIKVLREGFAVAFQPSIYNQRAIIKVLYNNLLTFIKLQDECRTQAKAIADAATAALNNENPTKASADMSAADTFQALSAIMAVAAAIVVPPIGAGAVAVMALSVASGSAGFAGTAMGASESGYEDQWNLWERGGTPFELMDNVRTRLLQLGDHIYTGEKALQDNMEKDLERLEASLKDDGYYGEGRCLRPYSPGAKDINTKDFKPSHWE